MTASEGERRLIEAGDKLADALSVIVSDPDLEARVDVAFRDADVAFGVAFGDVRSLLDEWERVSGEIDPRV